jgi:hypothetical protein
MTAVLALSAGANPFAAWAVPSGSGLRPVSGLSPVPQGASLCSPLAAPAGVRNAEFQPSMAVDPTSAQHIAAAWVQDFDDAIVVGVSGDGGATWTERVPGWDGRDPSAQPGMMACEYGPAGTHSARNPHVAVDKDGTVYAMADLASDASDAAVVVSSSPDGGATWRPVQVLAQTSSRDSESVGWSGLAVDPHRAGVVYALWDQAEGRDIGSATVNFSTGTEYVAQSVDGGQHWSTPHSIGTPDMGRLWSGGTMLVQPNGTLLVVFSDCPNSDNGGCGLDTSLRLVRSSDGGSTWTPPVDVTARGPVNQVPDAALSADGSQVYVAWFDEWLRGFPQVARSVDGGLSFTSAAVPVPGPVTDLNVAVSPSGTVGLLYYDRRNNADDSTAITDVWLARSSDGGQTFSETHVAGPFDAGSQPPLAAGMGEYQGLRAVPGGFDLGMALANPCPLVCQDPSGIFFAHVPD